MGQKTTKIGVGLIVGLLSIAMITLVGVFSRRAFAQDAYEKVIALAKEDCRKIAERFGEQVPTLAIGGVKIDTYSVGCGFNGDSEHGSQQIEDMQIVIDGVSFTRYSTSESAQNGIRTAIKYYETKLKTNTADNDFVSIVREPPNGYVYLLKGYLTYVWPELRKTHTAIIGIIKGSCAVKVTGRSFYSAAGYHVSDPQTHKTINKHQEFNHDREADVLELARQKAEEVFGVLNCGDSAAVQPAQNAPQAGETSDTSVSDLRLLLTVPMAPGSPSGGIPEGVTEAVFTFLSVDNARGSYAITRDLFNAASENANPALLDVKNLTVKNPLPRGYNPIYDRPNSPYGHSEAEIAEFFAIQEGRVKAPAMPWTAQWVEERDARGRLAIARPNDPEYMKHFTDLSGLTMKLPVAVANEGNTIIVKFGDAQVAVSPQASLQISGKNSIDVLQGSVAVSRPTNFSDIRFTIHTPLGDITSDKTRFWVAHDPEKGYTLVGIWEGSVSIAHAYSGETTTLKSQEDGKPNMAILLDPKLIQASPEPQAEPTAEQAKKGGSGMLWVILPILIGGGFWLYKKRGSVKKLTD